MTDDELRLEIAKAKGWRFYESHPSPLNHTVPHFQTSWGIYAPGEKHNNKYWIDEFPDEWPSNWSNLYGAGDIPDWPTDIRAAWELVEEMREHNISVALLSVPYKHVEHTPYEIKLYHSDTDAPLEFFYGWADTAARAICLAWLKWKGEK